MFYAKCMLLFYHFLPTQHTKTHTRTGCDDISFDTVDGSHGPKNTSSVWFGWNVYIFYIHNNIVFDKGKCFSFRYD